jgi:hypothetical protein
MDKYPQSPEVCHAVAANTRRHRGIGRRAPGRWASLAQRLAVCFCLAAWCDAGWGKTETSEDRPADATEVFHCDFDETWDVNYDHWPDRWVRKTGPDFPHYVDIQIRELDGTSGDRALVLELDGASASVSSPPIRVMSRFSYELHANVRFSGVQHSEVSLTIDFFNSSGELVQSRRVEPKSLRDGPHKLTLTSIDPQDAGIDRAVIRVDVQRHQRGDLKGKVVLEDIWLARLPRITVTTNSPFNVYDLQDEVVVRCELSGIRERNPEIRFQLLDASSKELHGDSVHLNGRLIVEDTKKASQIVDGIGDNTPKGYEGATEWRPNIPGPGFYSVVVRMLSSDDSGMQSDEQREMDSKVICLALAPRLAMPVEGDFGWSLPAADDPLSFAELVRLLPMAGINWVKVPAWYDASDTQRGDEIIRFVEMLGASNIEVVGIINRPPADSELGQRFGRDATVAEWLDFNSSNALPSLDPVMSRLSMRLRWWQLGDDQDMSFMGFQNVGQRINELRRRLFRFGQEAKLGMTWTCDGSVAVPTDASWEFEQLTPDPNLSLAEFETLMSQRTRASIRCWVTIDPPPLEDSNESNSVDLDARATVFVRKIVAAKQHGVDGIFVSKPFDSASGLMRPNGMPAELLLAWRTAAAMLSGAKFLGSVQLPGGSENRYFLRPDGQVVMVVWNEVPVQEVLFLGHHVKQYDLWGQAAKPAQDEHRQVIDVGPLPSFILGLSEPVARWRMALKFEQDHVPSVFGVPHPNAIHFKNFFPQGVGGTISIVAPQMRNKAEADDAEPPETPALDSDRWSIEPPEGSFGLAKGEEARFPFEVRLKDAIFGEQPMRVDFVVDADALEPYRFSVYRTMWVGTGDVTIEIKTHVDKDGSLVVQQFMTNTAERLVDFKCTLHVKGHRRQRAQVYRLGSTPDRTIYRFPDGQELVGQEMRLEAEEIGGLRVLKYRFTVTDDPPPDEPERDVPGTPPASNEKSADEESDLPAVLTSDSTRQIRR